MLTVPDVVSDPDEEEIEMWFRKKKPTPTCQLCGVPATQFKKSIPWQSDREWWERRNRYSFTSYTCDAHESYLHGVSWGRSGDDDWHPIETGVGTCAWCPAPYGTCDHSRKLAAKFYAWEAQAERGSLTP